MWPLFSELSIFDCPFCFLKRLFISVSDDDGDGLVDEDLATPPRSKYNDIYSYSQSCLKRSSLEQRKIDPIRQMTA